MREQRRWLDVLQRGTPRLGEVRLAVSRLAVSRLAVSTLGSARRAATWLAAPLAVGLLALAGGCDLTRWTLNGAMTDASLRAGPAASMHWDYELVGQAAAYNLLEAEGYLRIAPENEVFLKSAVRGYISYAYGWVEDEAEVARLKGDEERGRELDRRAIALYARARDIGKYWLGHHADGFDAAMRGGEASFKQWLKTGFTAKKQAEVLLWAGYAWGSHIAMAKDNDVSVVADLPFATALVERSLELDPELESGSGFGFLALVKTRLARSDDDLKAAKSAWEKAAQATQRKSLLVLVSYAHAWAVKAKERETFRGLLREILEAGDIDPSNRLSNRIAKRRAARYLMQIDTLFPSKKDG